MARARQLPRRSARAISSASRSSSDETYEATTLGGLVSEIEGRIPAAGEVVSLEPLGLRVEVVASTGRRIERLRLFPPTRACRFPKETQAQVIGS